MEIVAERVSFLSAKKNVDDSAVDIDDYEENISI